SQNLLIMMESGKVIINYAFEKIIGDLWEEAVVGICGSFGKGVLIGQAVGKSIANFLFSTDKTIDQYYSLRALVNFEDVIVGCVRSLSQKYNSDETSDNADSYLRSVELLLATYNLGCDYTNDFAEIVFEKGLVNKIKSLYGENQSLATFKTSVEEMKKNIKLYYGLVSLNSYKYYLKEDAPELYKAIYGNRDNTDFVSISDMQITQTREIFVGNSGSASEYFDITYFPSNHTEIILFESVSSSNENVIRVDDNFFYSGCIAAVGVGTCILTVETSDKMHSVAVEVTVNEKESESQYNTSFNYMIQNDGTACITKYNGNSKNVIVPTNLDGHTVTEIGSYAFANLKNVEIVALPTTVTSIGNGSFENCINLKTINLPSSLTYIGDNAFENCRSLTSIAIPRSITELGSSVFMDCVNLKSVLLPASRGFEMCIEYNTFSGCNNISNVVFQIPAIIENNNINNYLSIQEMFPDSYKTIHTIKIPNGITNIPDDFFKGCELLKDVNIPNSVKNIGNNAFYDCKSLENVEVPDSVANIGSSSFFNCTSLTEVLLPSSLTQIEYGLFDNCISITSIRIPDSVEIIGDRAFYNCTSLKAVTMPCSAKCAEDNTRGIFTNCEKIEKLTLTKGTGTMAEWVSHRTPQYESRESLKEVVLSKGIKNISPYAFSECNKLTTCKIPKSVEKIGKMAFAYCSSYDAPELHENITYIGADAFKNTSYYLDENNWEGGLLYLNNYLLECKTDVKGNVKIKEGTTVIANEAFQHHCYDITNVELPNSLLYIGEYAFSMCYGLKEITILKNIINIGDDAFEDCKGLENIFVEDSNEYYCDENGVLFSKDKKTIIKYPIMGEDTYTIPDGVTKIYYCAFEWCSGLKKITIPESVKSIGDYAFFSCYSLSTIDLPSDLSYLGKQAFFSSGLEYIEFPKNISTIREKTCSSCSKLSIVVIPEGVKTISESAFSHCSKLTTVQLSSTVTDVGYNAFYNCSSLKILSLSHNVRNFENLYNENLEHIVFDGTKEEWDSLTSNCPKFSTDKTVIHFNSSFENVFEKIICNENYFGKGYYVQYHCKECNI
ncbi:MAG: leucine-rich repeat domain-containing protein, partial [Lachnospiraceae bacterium]|nr:leucine-rich repeat domain-containing protein [Lachnospiraceae bacterium]